MPIKITEQKLEALRAADPETRRKVISRLSEEDRAVLGAALQDLKARNTRAAEITAQDAPAVKEPTGESAPIELPTMVVKSEAAAAGSPALENLQKQYGWVSESVKRKIAANEPLSKEDISSFQTQLNARRQAAKRKQLGLENVHPLEAAVMSAGQTAAGFVGGLDRIAAHKAAGDVTFGETSLNPLDAAKRSFKEIKAFAAEPKETWNKYWQNYDRELATTRDIADVVRGDHPIPSAVGAIAAGAALRPTTVPQAALIGAGSAAGQSRADLAKVAQGDVKELGHLATDAAMGGGASALGFKFPVTTAGVGAASGIASDSDEATASALMGAGMGLAGKARLAREGLTAKKHDAINQAQTQAFAAEDAAGKKNIDRITKAYQKEWNTKQSEYDSLVEGAAKQKQKEYEKALKGEAKKKELAEAKADKVLLDNYRKMVAEREAAERLAATGTDGAAEANPDAVIDAMLGNRVKEGFQFVRTKDPLKLQLTPEAEAGVQAILPDYQAKANEMLGQFAGGKGAVRERIAQEMAAKRQAAAKPKPPPGPGEEDTAVVPIKPELLTPKPKPAAEDVVGDEKLAKLRHEYHAPQDPTDLLGWLSPQEKEAYAAKIGKDFHESNQWWEDFNKPGRDDFSRIMNESEARIRAKQLASQEDEDSGVKTAAGRASRDHVGIQQLSADPNAFGLKNTSGFPFRDYETTPEGNIVRRPESIKPSKWEEPPTFGSAKLPNPEALPTGFKDHRARAFLDASSAAKGGGMGLARGAIEGFRDPKIAANIYRGVELAVAVPAFAKKYAKFVGASSALGAEQQLARIAWLSQNVPEFEEDFRRAIQEAEGAGGTDRVNRRSTP